MYHDTIININISFGNVFSVAYCDKHANGRLIELKVIRRLSDIM